MCLLLFGCNWIKVLRLSSEEAIPHRRQIRIILRWIRNQCVNLNEWCKNQHWGSGTADDSDGLGMTVLETEYSEMQDIEDAFAL